jgi:two-component system, OmpR family, sensor histidine kinase BaeS
VLRTLFARTLLGMAASLVLLASVLGVLFFFGLQRSVTVWNVNRTRHLQATFSRETLRVSRQEGSLAEEQLFRAFSRFLTPGASVVVLTPEREPVFVYDAGIRLDSADYEQIEPILGELGRTRNPALAVFDEDRLIAYVSVDSLGFRSDLTNRIFLNSILFSVLTALGLSLLLALAGALLISRRLTRQARLLAVGLTKIAQGNRDVTFPRTGAEELRAIAEAAVTLQTRLAREERLRKQWMQDVAHDLRTPITALGSQLEGMIEGVLEPTPERLISVYHELERAGTLVSSLRELSRVESPELSLDLDTVPLDVLISTAVERVRSRPDASSTTWDLSLSPLECCGDEALLLRSITNLLDNAVIHGEENQTVSVETRKITDHVVITIANRGWIPESDRDNLFDRLYRGDRGRSTPGSGLGLAIVHAIVTRHGGRIAIRQEAERVVAEVTLPIGECRQESSTDAP